MSESQSAKRSKTYRENKKKQKIDQLINNCLIKQTEEKSNDNDGKFVETVEILQTPYRSSAVKFDNVKKHSTPVHSYVHSVIIITQPLYNNDFNELVSLNKVELIDGLRQQIAASLNESVSGIIKIEPKEAISKEEDRLMLELIDNCSPSVCWPFCTVELKNTAMTNSEPLLNLNELKVEPGVFTQESDENSTDAQQNIVKLVKQHKLLKEVESLKSMKMPPSKFANQKSDSTKSNVNCNGKETDSTIETTEDQNYNQIHQLNDYVEVDCFDLQSEMGNQILNIVKETNAIAHENKIKLDTLTKDMDTIKKNQTTIMNFLMNKQLVDIEPADFKTMYNVDIPCKGLQDFQYFDEQLSQNELLKADVITQLSHCIDQRDCSLTKSFTNMLRLFMTTNALSNFTAIRKSAKSDKDRHIFISTNLYKLMSGIATKERRDKNLAHDIKDLHSALSDVISHSSKWPS